MKSTKNIKIDSDVYDEVLKKLRNRVKNNRLLKDKQLQAFKIVAELGNSSIFKKWKIIRKLTRLSNEINELRGVNNEQVCYSQ